MSDGMIHTEVSGIKGKKCMDYIKVIEELAQMTTIHSKATKEYYEPEDKVYLTPSTNQTKTEDVLPTVQQQNKME